MSQKYVIITAGGKGERMGATIPKQFLKLEGLPVIFRSMHAFFEYEHNIQMIVVLPVGAEREWEVLCKEHGLIIDHQICPGGETRFESVRNGLNKIPSNGLVAIHDAVRPLVSTSLIEKCFKVAEKHGNAIPAVSLTDSIREVIGDDNRPVERDKFRLIQTPQVFDLGLIKTAYEQAYRPSFTDDATVAESNGTQIRIIEGEKKNIKITSLDDMYIASALLRENA